MNHGEESFMLGVDTSDKTEVLVANQNRQGLEVYLVYYICHISGNMKNLSSIDKVETPYNVDKQEEITTNHKVSYTYIKGRLSLNSAKVQKR